MGADVAVLDRNPEALRRVDAVLGIRVRTLFSTRDVVELLCQQADLVIATLLVPGSTTPKLITVLCPGATKRRALRSALSLSTRTPWHRGHSIVAAVIEHPHPLPQIFHPAFRSYCVNRSPHPHRATTLIPLSIQQLICTGCGAETNAACNCGKTYKPSAIRVKEYDEVNRGKSTRQAAADLGVSKTV